MVLSDHDRWQHAYGDSEIGMVSRNFVTRGPKFGVNVWKNERCNEPGAALTSPAMFNACVVFVRLPSASYI